MINVALTSDTHHGITKTKTIRKMLKEMYKDRPIDVLVHAGDYTGGRVGHKSVKVTLQMIRDQFPELPFVSVLGNHDFWCGHMPTQTDFDENYDRICQLFREFDVHFLDEDGPFRYEHLAFVGHSGWYSHANPPTNDSNFLPIGLESHTHRFMHRRAIAALDRNLEILGDTSGEEVVFVSHFPVIRDLDWKGSFDDFSWVSGVDERMANEYECRYFLNGHAHSYHDGPIRYESGSDYNVPQYLFIEFEETGEKKSRRVPEGSDRA